MKVALETSHIIIVEQPGRGQTTEKVEKNGEITFFDIPSYKSFVYQPILTKFHTKVALLTSHITILKFPEKAVKQLEKAGKIMFFNTPKL
jgi:hypothetical protein